MEYVKKQSYVIHMISGRLICLHCRGYLGLGGESGKRDELTENAIVPKKLKKILIKSTIGVDKMKYTGAKIRMQNVRLCGLMIEVIGQFN